MAQRYIGAPIRRKEDGRFLTGQGQFVDDVKLPNMLHAAILRSPHPHARILSIDSSVALGMDGVAGVITFQDIEDAVERSRAVRLKNTVALGYELHIPKNRTPRFRDSASPRPDSSH